LETLKTVYAALKESKVDRTWALLAVGGGTVSDLAGFVASTWMRGIEFFVAPTTLLSMVDAALGGKNGLNFDGTKKSDWHILASESGFLRYRNIAYACRQYNLLPAWQK